MFDVADLFFLVYPDLLRRQEELRRMEEMHSQEMQKRKEMQIRLVPTPLPFTWQISCYTN